MKYNEREIIKHLEEYIESTYSQHYTKGDFQIQDLFEHIDIAEEFCRGAAIKYLIRFGKKEGKPTRPKDAPALYTINPSNASVWFFGNSPNHPPVFNRPTKPGYVSPKKRPEPAFLEQAAENIEKNRNRAKQMAKARRNK